jgi:Holliday junction resolvase-like predicted endonuclease
MLGYETFKEIFDKQIFANSKSDLLEKVSKYPDRYVGLFRPTKPKTKLLQNMMQSHEIRFGDAFEKVIEKYFASEGGVVLDKNIKADNGEDLEIDQLLKKNGEILFIEQKVRDDHDSTKKRGQIVNFENKLHSLIAKYGSEIKKGFFYFIDSSLVKNKNYYQTEIDKMADAWKVELHVSYGQEMFDVLDRVDIWNDMIDNLEKWREQLPELPEVNFDLDPSESFEEIKNLPLSVFKKLFTDERIIGEILPVVFPQNATVRLLLDFFNGKDNNKSVVVSELMNDYLNR